MASGWDSNKNVPKINPMGSLFGVGVPKEIQISPKKLREMFNLISGGMSLRRAAQTVGVDRMAALKKLKSLDMDDGSGNMVNGYIQYRCARVDGAESRFDDLIDLADDIIASKIGFQEGVAAWRIKAWELARSRPELYSDKASGNGDNSVTVKVVQG